MLEHLFGSKTRLRLLRLLFRYPERSFYVRELTRELETQINAVRRELQVLQKAGIILETDEPKNGKIATGMSGGRKRKYYSLDQGSLLYPELNSLLLKGKILGEQRFIEELKNKSGDLKLLVLTGNFTGADAAPTDMLLVGEIKERTVTKMIADYEGEFGSGIRYTFLSEQEFYDRRHVMDKFLFSIFEGKHLKVVNELHV